MKNVKIITVQMGNTKISRYEKNENGKKNKDCLDFEKPTLLN